LVYRRKEVDVSIEVASSSGSLGTFASNGGYSDLIKATESDSVLSKFFRDANTEDVSSVEEALNKIKEPKDVATTAHQLAALIHGQSLVYITNGTYDKSDEEVNKVDSFQISGDICKLDRVQHLVFGWASIVTINGKEITDTQGDIITPETLEDAAYEYVLTARKGGEMHDTDSSGEVRGISNLVESVVFTNEKQTAMLKSLHDQGITDAVLDLRCVSWWCGFKIYDEDAWSKVESGELRAFSIGGKGKRDARP
jgi:hypothetical protein